MQQPRLSTVIWRGKWIIVVAILAGLAAAALATTLSSKVYEATALLDAGGAATASSAQDSFDQQQAGEALARSYATTLDSPSFLARIAPSIDDGRLSGEELHPGSTPRRSKTRPWSRWPRAGPLPRRPAT